MTAADFRRIALSLAGAEEGSHMGSADFRVGGRIFATLAGEKHGYGNLMLTPEQQAAFVREAPGVFLPVAGGWGLGGATHLRLSEATEDILLGALTTAWQLRLSLNTKARGKGRTIPRAGESTVRETGMSIGEGAQAAQKGSLERVQPGRGTQPSSAGTAKVMRKSKQAPGND